jgi:hypothetical protein
VRPREEPESAVVKESWQINSDKFFPQNAARAPALIPGAFGPPPNRHQTATKTSLQQFKGYYR